VVLAKVKKTSMHVHHDGGSWICGAPPSNALTTKSLELINLHEHKYSRHKLELPNIENVVGN